MAALLFIAATLIATGCSNGKEAKQSAQEFLDYFFATEYEMAQELCTDEVKEYLESGLKEFMALPQETKESVKRQVSSFKAVVESMEKLEKNQIKIYYSVISAPDTLPPQPYNARDGGGLESITDLQIVTLARERL